MSYNNPINEMKKALLAYKEKILEELQYYEKQIDDFRANHRNNCYYDDTDSSDSEDYLPKSMITCPDELQLKLQQKMLKNCLQATQQLTSLTILQSKMNVLVQDPQFDSSDSEDYLPKSMITGPDELQLKLQQKMLKNCLQATQELTSLTILQ